MCNLLHPVHELAWRRNFVCLAASSDSRISNYEGVPTLALVSIPFVTSSYSVRSLCMASPEDSFAVTVAQRVPLAAPQAYSASSTLLPTPRDASGCHEDM